MLNYHNVIKSSTAFNIINRDLESSRLSHAYLFLSQDENYLKIFCENVCKIIINKNELENITKNNLRIEKHMHPDVKIFGEEKIDVKIASQIVEEADYSPFEADKKIFVLYNIQEMNEAAQNKILKTIEEPPKNTYFLLTANSTSKILPTILSRVKEIKLEPISKIDLVDMLLESNIGKQNAEISAACSYGNATFAEKISLDAGFIEFYNNIVSMLFLLDGSKDVLKYSVIFNDKKIDKNEFFDICTMILRDVLFVRLNTENLIINKNILENLKQISKKLNENALLELISMCTNCKEMLAFNVNNTATIDEFLYKLAEVKVKCRRL